MPDLVAELVVDCRNLLGEGVLWDAAAGRLLWTDIEGRRLWHLDPATGQSGARDLPDRLGSFAPRATGGLIAAFADGFALYAPATGSRTPIAEIEADIPDTRLNDGRTDRQGRFLAGGYNQVDKRPLAGLYRVDRDLTVTRLFGDIACANSLCFSPDGRTMYFADTAARRIDAYDYDAEAGTPANRRRFCGFEDQPGRPDGSTVDAEGYLWNAQWNGHRVVRYAPDGRIDRIVRVPVLNPTCVAFGGRDLDTLYITTARFHAPAETLAAEPAAGGLFAIQPGVSGLPDKPFAG